MKRIFAFVCSTMLFASASFAATNITITHSPLTNLIFVLGPTPTGATAPAAPSGLSATAISTNQIDLSWTLNSTGQQQVWIERSLASGGPFNVSWPIPGTNTTYSDTTVSASTTYYYRVRAIKDGLYSNYSNQAGATTADPPINPIAGDITIPATHPRLWFTAARRAQATSYYQSTPFTPPTTISTGDDAYLNALHYLITSNSASLSRATNWLVNYTLPAAQVLPTAIGCDNCRYDGENAAAVFDWCYPALSAGQKTVIIDRWNGYLTNVFRQTWGGVNMQMNNYYWGNLRNDFEWGVATMGDNSVASTLTNQALVSRWKNSFVPFAGAGGKGGVWQEGPSYGPVVGWYATIPFQTANNLGRDMWGETNWWFESAFAIIYGTTPAATTRKSDPTASYELFPWNDEEYYDKAHVFYSRKYVGDWMYTVANQWSTLNVGKYARQWINTVVPTTSWHVSSLDNGGTALSYTNLPLDYYASGNRFLYGRSAWDTTSMAVHFQLGIQNAVGHQHRDAGNWQLWKNGIWLSRETTGYNNTFLGYGGVNKDVSSPEAHNVFLVNGVGQLSDSWIKGPPVLRRLERNSTWLYAAVDLSECYRANADFAGRVPEAPITNAVREFVFLREPQELWVCDRIGPTQAVTYTFLAHSETNAAQPLTIENALGTPTATRLITEGGTVGQYRTERDHTLSTATNFVKHMYTGVPSTNIVTFNGGLTLGGTVNGAALGSGIATCSVSSAGVTWTP